MSAKLLEGPTMYNNRDAMMMPFHDGARDFFFPSLFSRLLVFFDLRYNDPVPGEMRIAPPLFWLLSRLHKLGTQRRHA